METSPNADQNSGKEDKLNWMYAGPSGNIDREEYLLGRAIDKNFEKNQNGYDQSNENENNHIPKSVIERSSTNIQVDLASKLHEDPLVAIRKKELEARKQLLNNPVKLKEIREMLKVQKSKTQKEKLKNQKKARGEELDIILLKKFNKLRSRLNNITLKEILMLKVKYLVTKMIESSTSTDSERESRYRERRSPKMKSHKTNKHNSKRSHRDSSIEKMSYKKVRRNSKKRKGSKGKNTSGSSSSSNTSSSSSDETVVKNKRKSIKSRKKSKRSHSPSESRGFSSSDENSDNHIKKSKYDKIHKRRSSEDILKEKSKHRKSDKKKRNSSSEENVSSEEDHEFNSSNSIKSKKVKSFGLITKDGSKKVSTKSVYAFKPEKKTSYDKPKYQQQKRDILNEKDREMKLKEMMDNAKWHEKERTKNMEKYKAQEQKDEIERSKEFDDGFARKHLSYATSKSSVAERIKSNINNIQRSKDVMEKSFVRK